MRTAWIKTLVELGEQDPDLWLVVGDLGYTVVEPFMQRFPNQYLNAGVAEQDMTGVAAGLAISGKTVFTYSIANFPVMRCLEQIRNDICYHRASVVITSIGGGFTYGPLGATHHGTEDLGVMRTLPNMTVVAPGDPVEAALATRALAALRGPGYLRLGKAGEPIIHTKPPHFELGKALLTREGGDVAILSTGGMLVTATKAAEALRGRGIEATVLSVHTLKPFDAARVVEVAKRTGAVLTLEEHNIVGGLGSATAEALMDAHVTDVHLRRLGVPDTFAPEVGSQDHLRNLMGLSVDHVVRGAEAMLAKVRR